METLPEQIQRIAEQIQRVVELRARRLAQFELIDGQRKALEMVLEPAVAQYDRTMVELAEAEAKIRSMAIAEYHMTGAKQIAPGVAIRVRKRLQYDDELALNWAIARGRSAVLQLRRAEFEKLAGPWIRVAVDDSLHFVTEIEEPTATLATDLAAVAKQEQPS